MAMMNLSLFKSFFGRIALILGVLAIYPSLSYAVTYANIPWVLKHGGPGATVLSADHRII